MKYSSTHKKLQNPLLFVSLVALLVAGCSHQPPATLAAENTTSPEPEIQRTEITMPADAAPALPTADDARQTVQNFLTALQLDSNSPLATQLLTSTLAANASAAGNLQEALLNTSESIPSFEVSAARIEPEGQGARAEATIYFQKPVNFEFSLVVVDGSWKIAEITLAGEYPSTPEEVVQAFLIAYQENPDAMSSFLTPTRRAIQPPGGSVGMLQILGSLEGVLVKSVVVNPAEPPQAAIVVLIRSGGVDSQRQFVLVNEHGRWGIDQILIAAE